MKICTQPTAITKASTIRSRFALFLQAETLSGGRAQGMESLRPLPALDIGALPGDVADGLGPLVERLSALLPPPTAAEEDRGVSLALFDSGPGQLGTPRVAQVAAWIALD